MKIDSTATYIKIDFEEYSESEGISIAYWRKSSLIKTSANDDSTCVEMVLNKTRLLLSHNGSLGLKVTSIDGQVPLDIEDLNDKIAALM